MSPFIIGGIGALARAQEQARRDAETSGDDHALRDVVVKRLGLPYDPPRQVGSLDAATLADRAEPGLALGTVPEGVRFLTAFVDVQSARFEVLVRGWGVRGESWIIAYRVSKADTAVSPDDWDALLGGLIDSAWPLADGSGRQMRLRALGYDSGGAPGVTAQAYDAWKRWRARRRVTMRGKQDGRDAWSVIPTKGLGGANAPKLQVVYPDTARKDRRASAGGQVPIAQFNANGFKDDLSGQLARASDGPWAVHFPGGLRAAEPPHPFFEGLVAETRRSNGSWEKTAPRNEPLDLMVGCHVVAHLHGLARLNWDRPPAWASPWETNPMVVAEGAAVQAAAPPAIRPSMPGIRVAMPKGGEIVVPQHVRPGGAPRASASARLA